MIFQKGNAYNLNDPGFSVFIPNTQFSEKYKTGAQIIVFLNDMQYIIIIPGDRKSDRYDFINNLFQPF